MYDQCQKATASVCMPVYYEQLVLQPDKWMRQILNFLELPWNSSVLNHEEFIGSKISLSMVERSTDQV
jgi:protein-tyrosine sulfotransferase